MKKSRRIIVSGDPAILNDDLLRGLVESGFEIDRCPEREPSIGDIRAKLPGAVGYLFGGFEYLDVETLRCGDSLRAVSLLGEDAAGFLDLNAAKEMQIQVTNTPGATTNAVAEFIIAEMLAHGRRMAQVICPSSSGTENHSNRQARELSSQQIGIVGLGRIGLKVAQSLRTAFGASVCYWNRSRKKDVEDALGIQYKDLNSLMGSSDFIVITIASDNSTEGLLGSPELNLLPFGSSLICVSKSRVLDFRVLLDLLKIGHLDSAWIDWFDRKFHLDQISDSQLTRDIESCNGRLHLSAHVANDTKDAWDRMSTMATRSLHSLLTSRSDQYEVRS
ncbi:MAG: NAD(P)-dependent oxidoreductase [Burkholderiales bacterium]